MCSFPVLIKDFFVEGLPASAATGIYTTSSKGMILGKFSDSTIYRVTENQPCSDIISSFPFAGAGANLKLVDPASWKGNFLLVRPAGQTSLDPEIPDGVGSLFILNGQITFTDTKTFTVKSYEGNTPLDICAALS